MSNDDKLLPPAKRHFVAKLADDAAAAADETITFYETYRTALLTSGESALGTTIRAWWSDGGWLATIRNLLSNMDTPDALGKWTLCAKFPPKMQHILTIPLPPGVDHMDVNSYQMYTRMQLHALRREFPAVIAEVVTFSDIPAYVPPASVHIRFFIFADWISADTT